MAPAVKQKTANDPWADPREFRYLTTSELIVNPRKQRECSPEKVARIAHEWDWARIECMTVAPAKEAGLCDVIEGQHRVLAAQQLATKMGREIALPCMLLEKTTDKEQSQIALDIVQGRRGHSAYEQWRLHYMSGHPHEVFATTVLEDLKLRVGKSQSATTISAVATVRRIVHGGRFTPEFGAELLRSVLTVIMDAFPTWDHESNQTRWDRWLLLAVAQIVLRNDDQLDRERLARSIKVRPAAQWVNLGKGAEQMPADQAIRRAIADEYNRGLRKGRIDGVEK